MIAGPRIGNRDLGRHDPCGVEGHNKEIPILYRVSDLRSITVLIVAGPAGIPIACIRCCLQDIAFGQAILAICINLHDCRVGGLLIAERAVFRKENHRDGIPRLLSSFLELRCEGGVLVVGQACQVLHSRVRVSSMIVVIGPLHELIALFCCRHSSRRRGPAGLVSGDDFFLQVHRAHRAIGTDIGEDNLVLVGGPVGFVVRTQLVDVIVDVDGVMACLESLTAYDLDIVQFRPVKDVGAIAMRRPVRVIQPADRRACRGRPILGIGLCFFIPISVHIMVHDSVCALVGRHRAVGGCGEDNVVLRHVEQAFNNVAFLKVICSPFSSVFCLLLDYNGFPVGVGLWFSVESPVQIIGYGKFPFCARILRSIRNVPGYSIRYFRRPSGKLIRIKFAGFFSRLLNSWCRIAVSQPGKYGLGTCCCAAIQVVSHRIAVELRETALDHNSMIGHCK